MTPPGASWFRRGLVIAGGIGLMMAMAVDSLAVIGRHAGIPLIGSIEIVQAMACIAACAAIVLATLSARHASVHFLTDRIPQHLALLAQRIAALVSVVFMLFVLAGSVWILMDTAPGHEQSEVLGISFIPLRLAVCVSTALTAAVFLVKSIAGRAK